MLSARGNKYAMLDLAAGYNKQRGDLYDKERHPDGLVSLPNAFNVRIYSDCVLVGLLLDRNILKYYSVFDA